MHGEPNRSPLDTQKAARSPLALVAHEAGLSLLAYVEPIAVEDVLPDMPIFWEEDYYVPAPLEATFPRAQC